MYAATPEDESDREDHYGLDTQARDVNPVALARLIAELRETNRAREDMVRAEQRLVLQAKAIQRRLNAAAGDQLASANHGTSVPGAALVAEGDPSGYGTHHGGVSLATLSILHLEEARAPLHRSRLRFERQLSKLAQQTPVWPWVESVRGFGSLGLAQIIGECGDLWNYDGPAKVWKRMGVGVIDGERQRRVQGASALEHGYVPRRRAIMWNIGESLLKGNGDGVYHTAYVARKAYEHEQHPEWEDAYVIDPTTGKKTKEYPAIYHKRARRYVEKMLLKHLWQAWRASTPRP